METNLNDQPQLVVEKSTSHGKLKYRPCNEVAEAFCTLLNQKSLTAKDLENIKALGYSITTKAEIL